MSIVEGDRGVLVPRLTIEHVTEEPFHLRCLLDAVGVIRPQTIDEALKTFDAAMTAARRAGFRPPKDPIR